MPGAGDSLRIVLHRTLWGRRLEASALDDLVVRVEWDERASEEPLVLDDGEFSVHLAFLLGPMLRDGPRLERWLRRNGIEFVGGVGGAVDRIGITPDGMVAMSGPDGDLLIHSTVPRLVLAALRATFRRNGYRTIAEFQEWLAMSAAAFLRSL